MRVSYRNSLIFHIQFLFLLFGIINFAICNNQKDENEIGGGQDYLYENSVDSREDDLETFADNGRCVFLTILDYSNDEIVKSDAENSSSVSNKTIQIYNEALSLLDKSYIETGLRTLVIHLLNASANRGVSEAQGDLVILKLIGWNLDSSLGTLEDILSESDKGNARVQFCKGLLYSAGHLTPSSVPHSLIYFTFSALGGDQFANMALGYRYYSGIGVEANCESALSHYHSVARHVYADVLQRFEQGGPALHRALVRRLRLIDELDMPTGSDGDVLISDNLFQYYQFMADKKNVSAMVSLGQLYYYGRHGVETDYSKAFYYFTLAAESGSSLAMAFLGEMYMIGSDAVPVDNTKALTYLRKAAGENNAIGQTVLGLAYLYGRAGLQVKPVVALELLLQAANQGWVEAQVHLGRLFLGNSSIKADYKMALQYFTMALQQGNVMAFYYLGMMHAEGKGVLRSCTTATELFKNVAERGKWAKWFTSAFWAYKNQRYYEAYMTYQLLAELGYEVAQSNVAFILEEGKVDFVPQSERYSRAFIHWQRSAAQGSTSSRIKLGDYFYYGYGTNRSYVKAAQQYRYASDANHDAQALFNLAYMHEQGIGLKRDLYLAKRYYDLAAKASADAQIVVGLALLKLAFYFVLDFIGQVNIFNLFGGMIYGGESSEDVSPSPDQTVYSLSSSMRMDWDFYAIPILSGILLILLIYRRFYRYHHQQ